MSREKQAQSENIFGNNLRRWREERKLTLQWVANILKTSASYVSEIERGTKKPSFEMLKLIREEFQIDLNHFIAADITQIVKDKVMDYQADRTNELLTALKEVDHLSDKIKQCVREGYKKAKLSSDG